MTTWIYHGPLTGLDLTDDTGAVIWTGMLRPGFPIADLPADHRHVAGLVAAGHLVPAVVVGMAATAPAPDHPPADADPVTTVPELPAARRRKEI